MLDALRENGDPETLKPALQWLYGLSFCLQPPSLALASLLLASSLFFLHLHLSPSPPVVFTENRSEITGKLNPSLFILVLH